MPAKPGMANKGGNALRNLRRLAAIVLASLALLQTGAPPASAAAWGVAVGSGIIVPGVPGPSGGTVSNSVHFNGTVTGAFVSGSAEVGSCSSDFSGSGTDSTAVGQGSGNLTCNGTGVLGGSISYNCALSYVRVGVIIIYTGACVGGGITVWICAWVPTNVNPTTAHQYLCTMVTVP
jgi:hypothetical protein